LAAALPAAAADLCTISRPNPDKRTQILVSAAGNPGADRYTACTTTTRTEKMGWLDYYLIVLFLALIGLLVVKFRG
jgi:energy-coupling factor transporter transmembrane protein EcfT